MLVSIGENGVMIRAGQRAVGKATRRVFRKRLRRGWGYD